MISRIFKNDISRYFDLAYFLRFALILGVLYFFNHFYLSIISPYGGYYSPFLDHYLNYPGWIRASILFVSNGLGHLMGLDTYIATSYTLRVANGTHVTVGDECLGLGVMSFWLAFILAHMGNWKKMLIWSIAGLLSIFIINCLRAALLLLALEHNWSVIINMDHHTMFNLAAYAIIIFFIFLYNKADLKSEVKS